MYFKEKVNSLIKKELGNIILKEIDVDPGILLTLTRVETDKSMSVARAYVSVLPDQYQEEVFALLKRNIYNLQKILNKRLKRIRVPKIEFCKETKVVQAQNIEKILKDI